MNNQDLESFNKHFFVISNFNLDPSYLFRYSKDYLVYDQSNKPDILAKLKNYNDPKIVFSKHVGHNVIDHLTFIVDNYENLPKTTAFIKGNIVGKYLNQQDWESLISRNSYTFLYNNRNLGSKELVQRRIHSGAVLEENTDWYIWNSPHKYFLHYNDMLNFLFEDAINSNFVLFSPGGGYIVEKERILRYPKSFYQGLIKILDYYCTGA